MSEACWFCDGKSDWALPPGTLVPTCNRHLGMSRQEIRDKMIEGGLDARYYKGKKVDSPEFTVKDSGQRQEFAGGMVRDTQGGKTLYSLVFDGPMLDRWAEHLTKGARKYEARNWMKAEGVAELERAKDSAARHFAQWMRGEMDEDHAAAVYFNINLYEYVKAQMIHSPTPAELREVFLD